MTRKLRRNYSLVVAAFIAILILLIVAGVLAQTSGPGQTTRNTNAVLAPAEASSRAQTGRPLTPWTRAGSFPVGRSQAKRQGARPVDGNALFLPAVLYDSGGSMAASVAVADVNGDGKPDLVVANTYSNAVGVLLGNGDGSFQPAATYSSGGYLSGAVAVADVNGDGKPDLVVASECTNSNNCEGSVSVLLGNGDGTFKPAVTYDSGGWLAFDVAVADVNRDGKPDLIVANYATGTVGVLLGNGDGTFKPALTYGANGDPYSVAVADMNDDNKPDLVVTIGCDAYICPGGGSVAVLLGNGDGTFQAAVTYGSGGYGPQSIAVADVNHDNRPDLVVTNKCASANDCPNGGQGEGAVAVLLGNGDGTFQTATTYDSGGSNWTSGGYVTHSIAVADVNGDGKPDVVVTNTYSNTIGVLLGNGDGTFQPTSTYNSGAQQPDSVVVADVNGDGKPDLLAMNSSACGNLCGDGQVGVLLNSSDPTTTVLASSLNPSVYGQAVTFTAAVSAASGTATGTVIFYDGTTAIGSATLAGGSASLSTSALAAGSHSITAAYQGFGNFQPSTSAPLNQVVNPATTTTSLASSLNPALVNELVTYTATVASQYSGAVMGTVVFQDGGSRVATVTIVGNHAEYTTKYSKSGTHSITATYSGDANNTGSVSPPLVEQIQKGFPSKTVLTTSGSPSFAGQPVTFTATVTSKRGAIPNGELVTFYDGATEIGTGATASSEAMFTTSSLTAKTHTIRATYAGDDTFEPSTGSVTQVVDKDPTTTALSSSGNPSQSGQAVTFTATVTSAGPTPTGKVKFMDGSKALGSRTLSGGVATLTTSKLAIGTHPITAQYLGDADSAESTSPVLDQVVQ